MDTSASAVTETPVVQSPGGVETVDLTAQGSMSSEAPVEAAEEAQPEAAPVEDQAQEAPKKERVSPKLAQLRAREAEVAQRAAEAEARLAEANDKLARLEQLKSKPGKALADLGISFNDLANAILQEGSEEGQTPSEIETIKEELQSLKTSLEEKEKKAIEEAQQAQERQLNEAITGIRKVIHDHIEANPDDFDMIRVTNNEGLVYDIMEESFRQRGEVMHYTDAAKLAEDYLYNTAKKLTDSKKLREAFVPAEKPKSQTRTSFGKTLTSQLGQMSSTNGKPDLSRMSHEERIRYLSKNVLRFN